MNGVEYVLVVQATWFEQTPTAVAFILGLHLLGESDVCFCHHNGEESLVIVGLSKAPSAEAYERLTRIVRVLKGSVSLRRVDELKPIEQEGSNVRVYVDEMSVVVPKRSFN